MGTLVSTLPSSTSTPPTHSRRGCCCWGSEYGERRRGVQCGDVYDVCAVEHVFVCGAYSCQQVAAGLDPPELHSVSCVCALDVVGVAVFVMMQSGYEVYKPM